MGIRQREGQRTWKQFKVSAYQVPGIVLSTLSKSAISLNLHGAQAGTIDVIPNLKIMNLSPVFTLPSHI